MRTRTFLTALFLTGFGIAQAGVVWDEATNGDISNDRFNPSFATLSLGSNLLFATSVQGDREYIRLDVPDGMQLEQLFLEHYHGVDLTAFIAIQAGTTFTEPPTGTNVANILGYTHFGPGPGNVGTDILDDMGTGAGAIGFVPPLGPGPYTYWIQQTGVNPSHYHFEFIVGTVPEPCTMAVLGVAGLALMRRRRRA